MYLREMGSVELLSREGEIAIAKRIEAGREMMIGGICESPLTMRALIGWRDALNESKMLLRDVIDLDATYGGGGFEQVDRSRRSGDRRSAAEPRRPGPRRFGRTRGRGADETAAEPDDRAPKAAEDGEGEESSISLAAMEAGAEARRARDLRRDRRALQEASQAAGQAPQRAERGRGAAKATERRYDKLKAEMVEAMKSVRLNNARIE